MKKAVFVLLQILFVTLSLCAQTEFLKSSDTKIALINSFTFDDDKNGVDRVISAYNTINAGHCGQAERYNIHENAEIIEKALQDQNISIKVKEEKRKQLEEIKNRKQVIAEECKKHYQKRYHLLVQPVLNEISVLLKQIKTDYNIIILDGVELEINGQLLGFNEKLNITHTIIPIINQQFKTGLKPTLNVDLPTAKVAVINTNTLFDDKNGIKHYSQEIKKIEQQIKQETGKNRTFEEINERIRKDNPNNNIVDKIWKAMQSYTNEKGFGIALDSTKKIPDELENIHLQDVTNDFISYYNQLNQ